MYLSCTQVLKEDFINRDNFVNIWRYFTYSFSVTKERTEVIFQGTYDNPYEPNAHWEEYDFKCKPGNVTSRPCLISPYHYRLDWLLWFAAFQVKRC